jgi:hypothetical protein
MDQDSGTLADSGPEGRLALAIKTARRGFRRDTEALVELLDEGRLLVALAKPVDDAMAESDELTLSPKLVTTDTGDALLPAFSSEERLGTFAARLGWASQGDQLSYCSLSLRDTFDAALELVRATHCRAMVLDPSEEHELLLQPRELDALRQGQPIPLVGYVRELPVSSDEFTIVSDLTDAEPTLLGALEQCISKFPNIVSYRLQQTMNRERDIDPHPTLTLVTRPGAELDERALRTALYAVFEQSLPAPGYIDIVFETAEEPS